MNQIELPSSLVSPEWLSKHLTHQDVVVLDASWHMPASGRNGAEEWQQQRIPGSRFFDFDGRIKDQHTSLPHMLPDEKLFSKEVSALGISNHHIVVIYDSLGLFAAPRAWWMFRAMGHHKVAVLNGGLPAWQQAGLPLEQTAPAAVPPGQFSARLQPGWIADADIVARALQQNNSRVLDARSRERFSGTAADPRPGVRAGHMPGALCLPFNELLQDGRMLPEQELAAIFAPLLTPEQTLICTCGSGVTAAILALGAELAGHKNIAVYDGSWTEWGGSADRPVEKDVC
ncbi:3-mercaptopyruvate sulfurtransferase [Oceanimonas smirnovii]|uniref:3-mercaptopyruvate sulfurtransferase n=1 Tax=Oceanimonas smirnovii TaxID=264574 RepID=UPI00036FA118|nr:3-mercaptopyruvate sulfurtransferase [Oceanimonas smirnovii]